MAVTSISVPDELLEQLKEKGLSPSKVFQRGAEIMLDSNTSDLAEENKALRFQLAQREEENKYQKEDIEEKQNTIIKLKQQVNYGDELVKNAISAEKKMKYDERHYFIDVIEALKRIITRDILKDPESKLPAEELIDTMNGRAVDYIQTHSDSIEMKRVLEKIDKDK